MYIPTISSVQASANGSLETTKFIDKQRGCVKINRYYDKLKPYYKLQNTEHAFDKTLIFESRFESGNLKRAVKV